MSTYGEMQVIVATRDNAGKTMTAAHDALATSLVDDYGGLTVTEGIGYWRNEGVVQKEPVTIYLVAVDSYPAIHKVVDKVRAFLDSTDQKSAYVRSPAGEVVFVERTQPAA